ncbi:GNAT family N-acetyltransferase [Mycobacterium sp. 852013-50091_SCH5140682]|uniref:GNAT family N-acetyltransferase n=1 Tax=Mycobacterium sp. 852013-50091_SCH5140682 TaxID=1834109 RepID=UPI0009ED2988|nr:GNAT family N-acetyltransferase [Mycobacterium sp. 852013-50091_SCH5140682]
MSIEPAALDLLASEIEVVWGSDSVGAEPIPPVVIVQADGSWRLHVAPTLPASSTQAVRAVAAELSDCTAASLLDGLHSVLAPVLGPLRREVTVSYDCSRPARIVVPGVHVMTTADTDACRLRIASDWGAQSDWERLLDSEFPWAAATDGDQVLGICETARWSPHGTEAGVWTLPAARGHGLAAALVGAWASQCVGRVPRLYYSTSADNLSSQRVAERLGLPRIGKLRFLTAESS